MKYLAGKYGMDFYRSESVTDAACPYGRIIGLKIKTKEGIPELSELIEREVFSDSCVTGFSFLDEYGNILYYIICPLTWFNMYGWK